MKFKYEDWIIHLVGVVFLVIFWVIWFKKVHQPKSFLEKNVYLNSLSIRFYLSFFIIIGLIYALIRDFIKLYNE